jgi:hypothetical protein
MFFSIVLLGAPGRRHKSRLLLAMLTLIILVPGCGGGGGGSGNPGPPPIQATPAGTYNVTVNAVSGSITSTTGFTHFVQ